MTTRERSIEESLAEAIEELKRITEHLERSLAVVERAKNEGKENPWPSR